MPYGRRSSVRNSTTNCFVEAHVLNSGETRGNESRSSNAPAKEPMPTSATDIRMTRDSGCLMRSILDRVGAAAYFVCAFLSLLASSCPAGTFKRPHPNSLRPASALRLCSQLAAKPPIAYAHGIHRRHPSSARENTQPGGERMIHYFSFRSMIIRHGAALRRHFSRDTANLAAPEDILECLRRGGHSFVGRHGGLCCVRDSRSLLRRGCVAQQDIPVRAGVVRRRGVLVVRPAGKGTEGAELRLAPEQLSLPLVTLSFRCWLSMPGRDAAPSPHGLICYPQEPKAAAKLMGRWCPGTFVASMAEHLLECAP